MAATIDKKCIKCGHDLESNALCLYHPNVMRYCKICVENLKRMNSPRIFSISDDECAVCGRQCESTEDIHNFRYCKDEECECWYCDDCECIH